MIYPEPAFVEALDAFRASKNNDVRAAADAARARISAALTEAG